MNYDQTTHNMEEIQKFAELSDDWWDKDGPLKTLHDINELRIQFMSTHCNLHKCSILDVGCGGGILSEGLAKLGADVKGIDAGSKAILVAQKHALDSQLPIDYECILIEDFEHKGFDVVSCMELLEHVNNPELMLEHSYRLLNPGGILFLSTINRTLKAYAGAIIFAEYILRILPKQTHDYKKFIKPSELLDSARRIGFELIALEGMHYNPISRKASLSSDVSINYLMALKK